MLLLFFDGRPHVEYKVWALLYLLHFSVTRKVGLPFLTGTMGKKLANPFVYPPVCRKQNAAMEKCFKTLLKVKPLANAKKKKAQCASSFCGLAAKMFQIPFKA